MRNEMTSVERDLRDFKARTITKFENWKEKYQNSNLYEDQKSLKDYIESSKNKTPEGIELEQLHPENEIEKEREEDLVPRTFLNRLMNYKGFKDGLRDWYFSTSVSPKYRNYLFLTPFGMLDESGNYKRLIDDNTTNSFDEARFHEVLIINQLIDMFVVIAKAAQKEEDLKVNQCLSSWEVLKEVFRSQRILVSVAEFNPYLAIHFNGEEFKNMMAVDHFGHDALMKSLWLYANALSKPAKSRITLGDITSERMCQKIFLAIRILYPDVVKKSQAVNKHEEYKQSDLKKLILAVANLNKIADANFSKYIKPLKRFDL